MSGGFFVAFRRNTDYNQGILELFLKQVRLNQIVI